MLVNTFSRNRRRENCEEPKRRSQSALPCLTFSAAMSCLDAKISLVPSNQLIVLATLKVIGPRNTHPNRQSHKHTKIHTLRPLTYQFFFSKQLNNEGRRKPNSYDFHHRCKWLYHHYSRGYHVQFYFNETVFNSDH